MGLTLLDSDKIACAANRFRAFRSTHPGGDLRLAQFHITPGLNRGSQLPGSNEFFDPNGSLVGAYDRSGVFWRGRPVEIREFFAKVREMRKGYRPRD
jgi:hypothetical protein